MDSINWTKNSIEENNYISRLIGLFGEKISEIWINNCSDYKNCGRPTIKWTHNGKLKRATLDFLLEREGKYYIVEQKNFFAYNKGKLRRIDNSIEFRAAFKSWNKTKTNATPAWEIFNSFEKHNDYIVKVGKIEYKELSGKILFWSDLKEADKDNFLDYTKELNSVRYNNVFGLVQMIDDLNKKSDPDYTALIKKYVSWNDNLFSNLLP